MRIETFDKIFTTWKVFSIILVFSIVGMLVLSSKHNLPIDAIIILPLFVCVVLSAIFIPLVWHIRDKMLQKRVSADRLTLLPNISLDYGDFEDGQTWTTVRRKRTYGKYDRDGVYDMNLMNKDGKYLLETWCDYIVTVDLALYTDGESSLKKAYADDSLNEFTAYWLSEKLYTFTVDGN